MPRKTNIDYRIKGNNMKVFISWSGDLSRELAETLRDWLPCVLQSVKPFFTPNDTEKGTRWGHDIANELQGSSVGIFCMTKNNLNAPWIMFEAGALSKHIDSSKVCPILFDGVKNTDLVGPLTQFQTSIFSEIEIRKLIQTINNALPSGKLADKTLETTFEKFWPDLDQKIQSILKNQNTEKQTPTRGDREILEEILELCRKTPPEPSFSEKRSNFKFLTTIISELKELNDTVDIDDVCRSEPNFGAGIRDILHSLHIFLRGELSDKNIDFEIGTLLINLSHEIEKTMNKVDEVCDDVPF
jgi:hypothetical protein